MLTHLVHFTPIPVTKEVAEELNTADPLGLRIELEIKLLKQFCTSPMFATQEREPFPQIADVTEMSNEARQIINGRIPATVDMVRAALHGKEVSDE